MITFKQRSLIGLAALFAIASTQACGSSDEPAPAAGGKPGTAGSPGTAGMGISGGGAASAGMPGLAGAPAGGGGAGGAAAGAAAGGAGSGGTGGASAGSGGSSAGAAGKGGSGGGSGGGSAGTGGASTATFAAVKTIFSASCGTGQCHNAGSMHTNFQTGDLYMTLTNAIPTTGANECNGTTLVTKNDAAGSFLVKVISNAMSSCKDAGADKMIPKMPFMCGTNPMCLSADKIKTISDWIAAGAPM